MQLVQLYTVDRRRGTPGVVLSTNDRQLGTFLGSYMCLLCLLHTPIIFINYGAHIYYYAPHHRVRHASLWGD